MHARYCHLKFRRTLWVCQKPASWVWRKIHGVSKLLGSMYVPVRSYVILVVAFCSRLKHACSCIHLFLSHDIKQGRVWFQGSLSARSRRKLCRRRKRVRNLSVTEQDSNAVFLLKLTPGRKRFKSTSCVQDLPIFQLSTDISGRV